MTARRWEHIDLTRAIAVISVVAYHFLRIDEIEGLNTVINTYFLSIFFFLSGFLLRPEADKAWIIKKAKRLLVPLVAFTILYIPILSLCKGELIGTTLSDMFRSDSKGGYWFVYTLFSAMALIWLIHYIHSVFALPKRLYPVLLILPWVIAFALSIFLPQEISYWLSIPSFRRYYLFILWGMLCQEIRPQRYFYRNHKLRYLRRVLPAVYRAIAVEISNGGFQFKFCSMVCGQRIRVSFHNRNMPTHMPKTSHTPADTMAIGRQFGNISGPIHYTRS